MAGMNRFTQKAKRVLAHAQTEAERMRKQTIGTEHLLLGLMIEEGTIANRVLRDVGMELDSVRTAVEEKTGIGNQSGDMVLGGDTQRVLELALEEAKDSGQTTVGTEHLLLAIARYPICEGMKVLEGLGVTPEQIRRQTRRVISETRQDSEEDTSQAPPPNFEQSPGSAGRPSSR